MCQHLFLVLSRSRIVPRETREREAHSLSRRGFLRETREREAHSFSRRGHSLVRLALRANARRNHIGHIDYMYVVILSMTTYRLSMTICRHTKYDDIETFRLASE